MLSFQSPAPMRARPCSPVKLALKRKARMQWSWSVPISSETSAGPYQSALPSGMGTSRR